jgi:hypothetical protein
MTRRNPGYTSPDESDVVVGRELKKSNDVRERAAKDVGERYAREVDGATVSESFGRTVRVHELGALEPAFNQLLAE